MSAEVLGLIAQYTAELDQLVDPPTQVVYGSDLSCTDDLDASMTELAEDDPLLIAQAAYRRITTARGSLPDDPDYGFDILGRLSRGATEAERRETAGLIKSELLKDDRIDSVTVTVLDTGSEIDIEIRGTIADPASTPFSLTMALTDSGFLLKEITAR